MYALENSPHYLNGKKLLVEFHWAPKNPKKTSPPGQPGHNLDRVHLKKPEEGLEMLRKELCKSNNTELPHQSVLTPSDHQGSYKACSHSMPKTAHPASAGKLRFVPRTSPIDPIEGLSGERPILQEETSRDGRGHSWLPKEKSKSVCKVFYRHLKRLYLMSEQTDVERAAEYHFKTEDGRETDKRLLRSELFLEKLSSYMTHK